MFLSFSVFAFEGQNMKFSMTCCLLAFYTVMPCLAAVWLKLFASTVCCFLSQISYLSLSGFSSETPQLYFEKAIHFSGDVLTFLPSIWLSSCLSSSMYRFIPPLSVLAPHDSNLAIYVLISWLFCMLYIPLFDLVQVTPWFQSSKWISSLVGISKILCTSIVASATRSLLVLKCGVKVQLSTDRKRGYDWLTASEQKWPIRWADVFGEGTCDEP